jgi:predicted ATPase
VSRFLDNAAQILDAAESAVQSGHAPTDMTILITAEGAIRMVADSDWPLESLQSHHGAKMAYRVSQNASLVRVEGRADSRTCLLETVKPERVARFLLNTSPSYWTAPLMLDAGN